MKFFGQSPSQDADPAALGKALEHARQRLDLFIKSIQSLLLFLHETTLDIVEIDTERFRQRLNAVQDAFAEDQPTRALGAHFDRHKAAILDHIQRQKAYIGEREAEFREIIDLMTAAMTGLDKDNREFCGSLRSQGERFEAITRLDDIKRIKLAMIREIESMRSMVREKETHDLKALDALSGQVDTLKKELDKARHAAHTDGLTGVHNRKALDQHLRRLIERNRVKRTPFALLMMDLDNFKQLNDAHGHTVGDRMLLAFADKCRASFRGDDFLARYGGEEFVAILPGASLRNAAKKARQLCKIVAGARYAADDSPTADGIGVTVSIGVSAYRKGDTVQSLVERADQCLYQAKAAGKNRAVAESAW